MFSTPCDASDTLPLLKSSKQALAPPHSATRATYADSAVHNSQTHLNPKIQSKSRKAGTTARAAQSVCWQCGRVASCDNTIFETAWLGCRPSLASPTANGTLRHPERSSLQRTTARHAYTAAGCKRFELSVEMRQASRTSSIPAWSPPARPILHSPIISARISLSITSHCCSKLNCGRWDCCDRLRPPCASDQRTFAREFHSNFVLVPITFGIQSELIRLYI